MNTSTLNERRDNAIFDKLSERTKSLLKALMRSPLAERAVAEVETETLLRRTELNLALAELDKAYPTECTRVGAEAARAHRAFEKAEQALREAREARDVAAMRCNGADLVYGAKRRFITDELLGSADPRLANYIAQCDELVDLRLKIALEFWLDTAPRPRGYGTPSLQRSNIEHVLAAKAALEAAQADARKMQLQSLSYADVSQALIGLCVAMAPSLAALRLNPPSLSAEHAEVGAPMPWLGHSAWVVDEVNRPTKEERAQQRQAASEDLKRAAAN